MFDYLCKTPSDINEHLIALRDFASKCKHITEMGTRKVVSTWAFAEGLKKGSTLIAIDMTSPEEYGVSFEPFINHCKDKGIDFRFIKGDTRKIKIDKTDLLFIDTNHTYEQLLVELNLHHKKVNKYLAFHDTVSCQSELMPAIEQFILDNPEWNNIVHDSKVNNGLLILEKKC